MLLQGHKLPDPITVVRDYLHCVAKEFGLTVHQFAAIRHHHFDGKDMVPSSRLQYQELHCDEKRYSVLTRSDTHWATELQSGPPWRQ